MKRIILASILVGSALLLAQCAKGPEGSSEKVSFLNERVLSHQTFKVNAKGVLTCGAKDKRSSSYQYVVALQDLDPATFEMKGDAAIKVWTTGKQPSVTLKDLYNKTSEPNNFLIINAKNRDDRPAMVATFRELIALHGGLASFVLDKIEPTPVAVSPKTPALPSITTAPTPQPTLPPPPIIPSKANANELKPVPTDLPTPKK